MRERPGCFKSFGFWSFSSFSYTICNNLCPKWQWGLDIASTIKIKQNHLCWVYKFNQYLFTYHLTSQFPGNLIKLSTLKILKMGRMKWQFWAEELSKVRWDKSQTIFALRTKMLPVPLHFWQGKSTRIVALWFLLGRN